MKGPKEELLATRRIMKHVPSEVIQRVHRLYTRFGGRYGINNTANNNLPILSEDRTKVFSWVACKPGLRHRTRRRTSVYVYVCVYIVLPRRWQNLFNSMPGRVFPPFYRFSLYYILLLFYSIVSTIAQVPSQQTNKTQ